MSLTNEVESAALELADRVEDLTPTDEPIRDAVVEHNAPVNFDPDHPKSVLEVDGGSGAVGSESSSYTELLEVPVDEIAAIELEHVLEGES